MLKKLFVVQVLTLPLFAMVFVFSSQPSSAEELPIVEVPIQQWAQNPTTVEQIVPTSDTTESFEVEAPAAPVVEYVESKRPSVQIDGGAIVVEVPKPNDSGANSKKSEDTSSNRPVLQAPAIEIPENKPEEQASASTGKQNKPVITSPRPSVQTSDREQIVVPDILDFNQIPDADYGSAELPSDGSVNQLVVETPQSPTPNPLWGALGLGLLGAAGSMTVLHFVRN